MDKIISFGKGIRRQPSIGEDGELSELVNLVPINGELVNVREMVNGKVELNKGHILLCVHNVSGRINYITKYGNRVYLGIDEQYIDVDGFKTASTLGNVVVIFCANETKYAIWNGEGYDITTDESFSFNVNIACASAEIRKERVDFTSPIGDDELFRMIDGKINEKLSSDTELFKYTTFGFVVLRVLRGEIYSVSEMFTLDNIVSDTGMYYSSNVATYGLMKYEMSLTYEIPESLKPIISSIDIYVSQSKHLFLHTEEGENGSRVCMNNKEVTNELVEMPFFLSKRIRLDEYESGEPIIIERYLDGAEQLEVFPSNVAFAPTISFNYNSSLNIANGTYYAKTNKNKRSQDVYIGIPEWSDSAGGSSNPSRYVYGYYGNIPDTSDTNKVGGLIGKIQVDCCIEVDVVEDNVLSKIRTIGKIAYPLPPVFTYPNINARKATIYLDLSPIGAGCYMRNLDLVSSYTNNYSLYVEQDYDSPLRYIQARDVSGDTNSLGNSLTYTTARGWSPISREDYSKVVAKGEEMSLARPGGNKVKKSVVENPFIFRDIDTVSIGYGSVKGLSTSAKALSQGQFGQFPLYAFCTDGIWALEVASDGSYSAKQPISRDVCNNPDSITQIDGAVVFTTDQGLKLIQGSEVMLLSDTMDGHNVDESIYFPPYFFQDTSNNQEYEEFDRLVINETRDFRTILSTCKIAYDYPNRLLRIFPEGGGKWYVYSLDTREFACEEPLNVVKAVVAGYPTPLVQIGTTLYTFGDDVDSNTLRNGLLLTRPIDMGEPFALKKLQDMKLHYTKHYKKEDASDKKCTFVKMVVYVSNDGEHWHVLPSLRKRSFKYYRVALITKMTDNDALSGMIMRYEVERTNKIR